MHFIAFPLYASQDQIHSQSSIVPSPGQVTMEISHVTLLACDWIIEDMNVYINTTKASQFRLELRNTGDTERLPYYKVMIYNSTFGKLILHGGFNVSLVNCTIDGSVVHGSPKPKKYAHS